MTKQDYVKLAALLNSYHSVCRTTSLPTLWSCYVWNRLNPKLDPANFVQVRRRPAGPWEPMP